MCPAFCLTDYKVQGSTLTAAILDLKNDPTIRGREEVLLFVCPAIPTSIIQRALSPAEARLGRCPIRTRSSTANRTGKTSSGRGSRCATFTPTAYSLASTTSNYLPCEAAVPAVRGGCRCHDRAESLDVVSKQLEPDPRRHVQGAGGQPVARHG